MDKKKVSPIKDKPLRLPAQSLTEEREAIFDDKIQPWLLWATFVVLLAGLEWYRYFLPVSPSPKLLSAIAAVSVAFVAWKIIRLRPKLRHLRQAIEGERVVGQFLERLREQGYVIFHDVVAPGFNIDHVLVGPAGIFSVETKTWSKASGSNAKIVYDGQRLLCGPHEPDRDPIAQCKAQANWLKSVITESTGRKAEVFPVLLFPGWYTEQAPETKRTLWVLEPKSLPAFLQREPARLSPEDCKLFAFHLSRFIRSVGRASAA
jgi:hypothetical protein